jgi:hypothetical protein
MQNLSDVNYPAHAIGKPFYFAISSLKVCSVMLFAPLLPIAFMQQLIDAAVSARSLV